MGLIKAGIGALGGTLADQWKEFFYCESMPKEVLVTKVKSASAAGPPIRRGATTLFPTAPVSPWPTGSA